MEEGIDASVVEQRIAAELDGDIGEDDDILDEGEIIDEIDYPDDEL
jgi:hypothetical protein